MSGAADYLPLLWAAVAAAAILAYVLMDGWVLGIGILYPLVARQTDRELLVESIAPFWNANEILLVLGALLLLLGFPTACSLLLTQLHFPVFVMLFALIVRAASHEFRHTGGSLRRIWELAFAGGSILAALAQGYIAGRLIEGFDGGDASSRLFAWSRGVFPIVCSFGLIGGYGLLGACWLISKADGALQVMGREVSQSTLVLAAAAMAAVCLFGPIVSPHVAHRWSETSVPIVSVLFAAAAAVAIWQLWASLWRRDVHRPLKLAVVFAILAFAGMAMRLYPYVVPYQFTLNQLANDRAILKVAGIGLSVLFPVIVLYLILGYRALRGKVRRASIPVKASPALASRKTCGNNVDLHLS
jgi:cytochrome bd ubiquinol oxidase subunit II